MAKYIYKAVSLSYSIWTGKSKEDYLQIINDNGNDGWRFVTFSPMIARPKGVKGMEMIFEKEVEETPPIENF